MIHLPAPDFENSCCPGSPIHKEYQKKNFCQGAKKQKLWATFQTTSPKFSYGVSFLTSYTQYDISYTEVFFVQQITVTIGPKSQVVIPKKVREIAFELRPRKKVTVRALNARSVIIEAPVKDWVGETYGIHKKIWQDIDATDYIRKLREEWKK